MRPEFGCGIHDYVFAPGRRRPPPGSIAYEVRARCDRWEPRDRRRRRRRAARRRSTPATLYIDISYTIRGTNDPRNLVFPFYVIPRTRADPATRSRPALRTELDHGLPAPNLDDRRFQDLVDDAKRLVQQRCPEWTDHNVSDPGVTLIETFAWMIDQLRLPAQPRAGPQLRQVPRADRRAALPADRGAGRRDVLALGAAADETCWSRAGTEVATVAHRGRRAGRLRDRPRSCAIVPCEVHARRLADRRGRAIRDHTERSPSAARRFFCFDKPPKPGDALLIGLSDAVPSCAVLLRLDCDVEGVGVDPRNPPLVWEAWDGDGWTRVRGRPRRDRRPEPRRRRRAARPARRTSRR